MPLSVRFAKAASQDLNALTSWLSERADPETAQVYVDRIRERCASLAENARRGAIRKPGRPPIRSIPFRRGKATILYRVRRCEVVVERIVHYGRDVDALLGRKR